MQRPGRCSWLTRISYSSPPTDRKKFPKWFAGSAFPNTFGAAMFSTIRFPHSLYECRVLSVPLVISSPIGNPASERPPFVVPWRVASELSGSGGLDSLADVLAEETIAIFGDEVHAGHLSRYSFANCSVSRWSNSWCHGSAQLKSQEVL